MILITFNFRVFHFDIVFISCKIVKSIVHRETCVDHLFASHLTWDSEILLRSGLLGAGASYLKMDEVESKVEKCIGIQEQPSRGEISGEGRVYYYHIHACVVLVIIRFSSRRGRRTK